jgi:putative ABC transport system permease protein
MIVRDGLHLATLGIILGLVLAAGSTRLISGWLFGVNPLDATTFLGMSAVFVVVALIASYVPARGAAAADPLTALRAE